jgi:hypothetical protein
MHCVEVDSIQIEKAIINLTLIASHYKIANASDKNYKFIVLSADKQEFDPYQESDTTLPGTQIIGSCIPGLDHTKIICLI